MCAYTQFQCYAQVVCNNKIEAFFRILKLCTAMVSLYVLDLVLMGFTDGHTQTHVQ